MNAIGSTTTSRNPYSLKPEHRRISTHVTSSRASCGTRISGTYCHPFSMPFTRSLENSNGYQGNVRVVSGDGSFSACRERPEALEGTK